MMVNVGANVGPYVAGMKGATAATGKFAASTRAVGPAAATATRGVGTMAGGMGMLAPKLLGPAGLIVGFGKAAASAIEFEAEAVKLRSQIGLTAEQADELAAASRRVGVEANVGGQEAVEASFFIASAGLRGEAAMEALERSAQAARIGLGETKDVADLVTSAMNAYGPEVLSAAQATDILVGAVKEGKAEAPALAGALGQILPIASEMGVTFDEVGAAVAAMTRTGTDAGTAAMQLRQILSGLLNPAQGVSEAMAEIGLSAEGLRATIREDGLWAALTDLRDAAGDNEETLGRLFPNVRSLAGFLDLTGANAEETAAIFDELADSTGNLDEGIDAVAGTTRDKVSSMTSEWGEFGRTVGGAVKPAFDVLVDGLTEVGSILNEGLTPQGGGPTQNVQEKLEALERQGYSSAEAAEFLGISLSQADTELDKLSGMAGIASTAIGETGDAAETSGGQFSDAAADVEGYLEAIARAEDPVLRLKDAVANLDEAEANYQDVLKEHGPRSDEAAAASWGVYEAVSAVQQAAIDGDLSFDQFIARLDNFVRQGWISKDAAEILAREVDGLRDSSEGYQGDYTGTFYADTVQAERALESLRRAVGRIPTQRMIEVSVRHGAGASPAGLAQFHHTGGIVGQHTGGMPFMPLGPLQRDEVPIIAQAGEEVLTADDPRHVSNLSGVSGSQLTPAPAGGGGGGLVHVHTTVELDGYQVGSAHSVQQGMRDYGTDRSRDTAGVG